MKPKETSRSSEKQEIFAKYTEKTKFTAAKESSNRDVAAYVERRKHDPRSKEEIQDDERWEKTKGKLIMALFALGVCLLLALALQEL